MRGIVALVATALPALATAATPDALLGALHEQTGVPGIAVAVSRNGVQLWRGEAGFADLAAERPVTSGTVFRLASVSKAVCSVIAAGLVEDEVLSLDTAVGELLPELPDQYHTLTLRDLMTHTSGLPHYEARDFARGRQHYESAVDGLEQLGDRPLVSPPGTTYLYSTHGFSLASAMMERATRKTFTELLGEILDALGSGAAIGLESEHERLPMRAVIYEGRKAGEARSIEREDFSYSWCGAGMEASAVDVSLFASALFDDSGFLGQQGQRLLALPLKDRNGDNVNGDRWIMTLGWRHSKDVRGADYLHHAGVTNGARSIVAVWPDTGLAVTLLSNASWTGRMEDTAVAFALAVEKHVEQCDLPDRNAFSGTFRDEPIAGSVTAHKTAESCGMRLRGDNELTAWFARFNFAEPDGQPLIRLNDEWWGLVSPIGISTLSGSDGRFSGRIGSSPVEISPGDFNSK